MKKVFVFGSAQCSDCVVLKDFLEAHEVRFTFIDVLDSLGKLKMFLKHRDSLPMFDAVKAKGSVGIPFLVVNDGEWMTLEGPSEAMLARLKN
jgi:arsenate reductase (glutaredoxin)